MVRADFRGTPTYFAIFKRIISSKNVNQNMLKIPFFFFEKFVKIYQTLEVPLPDPSWPPAAWGSAPRSLSPMRSYPHLLYYYKMF